MKAREDGYTLLGEAIVKQAADDYLKCRKTLYKIENGLYSYLEDDKKKKKIDNLHIELQDCLKFFNGEWYKQLTPLDSSVLLKNLDDAFEEYKTSKEFKDWKKTYDRKHKKK